MSDKALIGIIGGGAAVALLVGVIVVMKITSPKPATEVAADVKTAGPSSPATPNTTPPTVAATPAVLVAPKPVATTPPPAPKPGSITGSAWLTRNSGASDVMRGMNVVLLKPTMSSQPIISSLQAQIPDWEKLVADYRQMARDSAQRAKEFNDPPDGYWNKSIAEHNETAKNYERIIARIQALPTTLGADIDVQKADELFKGLSINKAKALPWLEAGIASAKTNVEGKYSLTDAPAGPAYVYAFFISSSNFIEWIVPVNVPPGGTVTVDLDNSNSTTLINRN